MSDWGNPWNWMGAFVLVMGWLFYDAMRPVKDYYVLQRRYFERLYEEPWRGKQLAAHYHGFDDYLAAKAVFERHEENYINVLDDGGQEAEHTLFMTTARTKSAALNRLKTSNAYSKELLLQTPYSQILKRRKYWKEFAQQQKQFDRIEDSLGDGR